VLDPVTNAFCKVALLGAVALACACGASSPPPQDEPTSTDNQSIEDSGKRLSGEFIMTTIDDSYSSVKNVQPQTQTVFSFDESGNVKKQDRAGSEEGSYVISTQGQLVIYVEKVNGEPLPAAKVEAYAMSDQRDDGFTLQLGGSRRLLFKKR